MAIDLASLTRQPKALLARYPKAQRWFLPVGGALAFLLFLIVTFPYDVLARRIEIEAQRAGAEVTIGRVGAGGIGSVRARDVRVRLASPPGAPAWPELRFERAKVSPDLFALLFRRTSFGFSLDGYGGSASGHVALSNDPRVPGVSSFRLDASDFDLAALPLREMSGVGAAGKLRIKADLPALLPVETARGTFTASVDGAALTGGTVMGFAAPRTALGRVDGSFALEKGVARVDKTTARGGDIEADVDGNINLRPLLSLSQADLHVRFRPGERWLNENEMLKNMVGLIQNARQGDGSYVYTFTGPLSRMTPRPGR
jgi:type II secretion system protein N